MRAWHGLPHVWPLESGFPYAIAGCWITWCNPCNDTLYYCVYCAIYIQHGIYMYIHRTCNKCTCTCTCVCDIHVQATSIQWNFWYNLVSTLPSEHAHNWPLNPVTYSYRSSKVVTCNNCTHVHACNIAGDLWTPVAIPIQKFKGCHLQYCTYVHARNIAGDLWTPCS